MEVKIPISHGLHRRPQLPFRSSPSLNRRSSSHGGAVGLRYRSRSLVVKRAAIISGNLDSIFDDEFRFHDYNLQLPKWREEIFRANMEQKANRVDIPFSLRIIKRKNQWKQGVRELVSESAYCSVKKAFSSMVFIIRELQSFSIQMREKQSYENLKGIINCVQREMHDSFVWLFQQVFSHTPTLMVSLMILLANYSVSSMAMPPVTVAVVAEHQRQGEFDSSSFSVSSTTTITTTTTTTGAKTISVGGSNGSGGGKFRPAARGAPDDSSAAARNYVQNVFQEETSMDEDLLWNSMVDEASRMEAEWRGEALDDETVRRLVSPVTAAIEEDDYYLETEMMYRAVLATDPNNSMLLANFGQFLYLVARDYDRAEVLLKKASSIKPLDPESLNKYANFLWHARNDISGAEQTYSAAVSASPSDSNYAAIYAHFLWTTGGTGGEETCNSTSDHYPHEHQ